MNVINQNQTAETVKIGPDLMTISGREVTIDALHEMPDWQVREFSRIPIYIEDWKFFLRERLPGIKPFAMRYVLERWPEDCKQAVNTFYTYDEAAVTEREAS